MNLPWHSLNILSGHFGAFAWQMFWQSSLLILVVGCLDLLSQRWLRPAVRYGLWLLVLIKFLIPPSFAVPSALAWWVRPHLAKTQAATLLSPTVQVSYVAGPNLRPLLPPDSRLTPASAEHCSVISAAALCSVLVSLSLLAWMAYQQRELNRLVRQALPAPAALQELLAQSWATLGVKRRIRLLETPERISPALCGLLRPTILIPESLASGLSKQQLRSVLLHELTHLKRGDIWVNWFQALLQVIFWWHPLLWLANARVRRLREEAVDDAVMWTLSEESANYAPTLLEVARLALRRPMAMLGFVGILESPSMLRQRIQRLMDAAIPRRSRIGIVSLLSIAAFGAVALPMGPAPEPPATKAPALSNTGSNSADDAVFSRTFKVDRTIFEPNLLRAIGAPSSGTNSLESFAIQLRQFFTLIGADPKAVFYRYDATSEGALMARGTRPELEKIATAVEGLTGPTALTEREHTVSQEDSSDNAENLLQDAKRLYEMGSLEDATVELHKVLRQSPTNRTAYAFLNEIRNARAGHKAKPEADNPVQRQDGTLQPADPLVIRQIRIDANTFRDNLLKALGLPPNKTNTMENLQQLVHQFFASIGVNLQPPKTIFFDYMQGSLIARTMASDVDLLEIGVQQLDLGPTPVQNQVDGRFNPVSKFLVGPSQPGELHTRVFKVDPTTFRENLLYLIGMPSGTNAMLRFPEQLRHFFADICGDFQPPKCVFFNDREGYLLVRATRSDIEAVQAQIEELNIRPPQIHATIIVAQLGRAEAAEFWAGVSAHNKKIAGLNKYDADRQLDRIKTLRTFAAMRRK